MVTLLSPTGTFEDLSADARDGGLWVDAASLSRLAGFELKPEGFCRDEICIPVPRGREAEFAANGSVDLVAFWTYRGGIVLSDRAGETWLIAEPAGDRARQLASLEAPDFTLPDSSGRLHSLSDYRGKKVLLAAWASW